MEGTKELCRPCKSRHRNAGIFTLTQQEVLLDFTCSLAGDPRTWAGPEVQSESETNLDPMGLLSEMLSISTSRMRTAPLFIVSDDSETRTHSP